MQRTGLAISRVDSFADTGLKSKCGSSAVAAPPEDLRLKFGEAAGERPQQRYLLSDAAPKQQCWDVRASVRCNAAAGGGVFSDATSLAALYRLQDDQQLGA